MPTRRFDALLIDFYGTISAGDRDAVLATCEHIVETCRLPVTGRALAICWGERFFDEIDRSNHASYQTLYECELESLRLTLAEFGQAPDPVPLVAKLEEYWVDPPVYRDAVDFLRSFDLPVCCVSNADTKPLRTALQKHRLWFDAVVTSEDARCYKPDPEIFRQALTALEVSPKRTLHVGDSLHSDVGGASKLGIRTVWLCRDSRIHDIGTCQPDYTIRTLAELAGVLAG